MRRRTIPQPIGFTTKLLVPPHHLKCRRTTTTIPQQLGAQTLTARTDDGKIVPLYRCTVPACARLFWSEFAARRCCEKYPLCNECGPKTGNLCDWASDYFCAHCKERRAWRAWLKAPEAICESDHIFWNDDKLGHIDEFWEAVWDAAGDQADEDGTSLTWIHVYDAFAAIRPYNTEPVRLNIGSDRESFADRLLDDIGIDWNEHEIPEEITTAIDQAYALLEAASAKCPELWTVGSTRPAGLLAELPDKAAEFVADWEAK